MVIQFSIFQGDQVPIEHLSLYGRTGHHQHGAMVAAPPGGVPMYQHANHHVSDILKEL